MTQEQLKICKVFDNFTESNDKMSTEMLLQMTADTCNCEVGDVSEALYQECKKSLKNLKEKA